MEIIACNDEVMEKLPKMVNDIYRYFGFEEASLYAVLEYDRMHFVVRRNNIGLFIKIEDDGYKTIPFLLNEDNKIVKICKDSYDIGFSKCIYLIKDNMEYTVSLNSLNEPNRDGYNGMVTYVQYNEKTDVTCCINFQHMYNEAKGKSIIYPSRLNTINFVHIDEKFSKSEDKVGFLPRTAKYFEKISFEEWMWGYKVVAFKEYGLINFIKHKSYELEKTDKVVRYIRSRIRRSDGSFRDFWPLSNLYTVEDMKKMITDYGFSLEIPELLLDVYNGYDEDVLFIEEFVKKTSNLDLDTQKKVMTLKLSPEDEE